MRLLRRVLVVVGAGALACVLLPISSAQAASTGGGGGGGGAPAAFFVVGDQSAALAFSEGSAVEFWGAQWAKDNSLSGGSAPASFKGYADSVPTTATGDPVCSGTWTARTGNSSAPRRPSPVRSRSSWRVRSPSLGQRSRVMLPAYCSSTPIPDTQAIPAMPGQERSLQSSADAGATVRCKRPPGLRWPLRVKVVDLLRVAAIGCNARQSPRHRRSRRRCRHAGTKRRWPAGSVFTDN